MPRSKKTPAVPRRADRLTLTLPAWLRADWPAYRRARYARASDRLRLTIELSRRNVLERTGGPFGAAVFEIDTGRLIAVGVNRVEALQQSLAHAEVMAIAYAQRALGAFDLGGAGLPAHELTSSAEPCLMCLGAILWSGVAQLSFAARRESVQGIAGFDEGPLPDSYRSRFAKRGIHVRGPRLDREASAVLSLYMRQNGCIYAARQGTRQG
ncbi:MAG: nucleoside deaminase [Vicinamibacteria bacterium]|jgi:tRNA(Arg) A34 adenosine deaminase TadA|nr:nucleoside deaminase [Vicinamibacteria bacterium]